MQNTKDSDRTSQSSEQTGNDSGSLNSDLESNLLKAHNIVLGNKGGQVTATTVTKPNSTATSKKVKKTTTTVVTSYEVEGGEGSAMLEGSEMGVRSNFGSSRNI
jgi:hypothetical protein